MKFVFGKIIFGSMYSSYNFIFQYCAKYKSHAISLHQLQF